MLFIIEKSDKGCFENNEKQLHDFDGRNIPNNVWIPYLIKHFCFQPSYTAHDTYGPRSSALSAAPKSVVKNKDKHAFHSMADMDWGWKRKRSMSPPLVAAYAAESDKRADKEVNGKSLTSKVVCRSFKILSWLLNNFWWGHINFGCLNPER